VGSQVYHTDGILGRAKGRFSILRTCNVWIGDSCVRRACVLALDAAASFGQPSINFTKASPLDVDAPRRV